MSHRKSIFDTFFSPENFQTPFLGNLDAFNQAWQETMQKNQTEFTQPPLTVEDLEKRIQALKSVENWLSMNLSMLKNTIQSLELQRSHMQSFQDMMNKSETLQNAGQQWWQSMQEQFNQFLKAQAQALQTKTTPTANDQVDKPPHKTRQARKKATTVKTD